MSGIYLHIPFCKQACHYCDFHFSTQFGLKDKVVAAIAKEIRLRSGYLADRVQTIYFGGGTPSVLTGGEIRQLLEVIGRFFDVDPAAEITLEANPDDLTAEKVDAFAAAGINRLSIGIQSFQEAHLKFMNRSHNSQQAAESVERAKEAGIGNISIDLIYAIPHGDHSRWAQDLQTAISLGVPHISAYCLTIEEKTVFGNWLKKGRIMPIDDGFAAEQFEQMVDTFATNGIEQYEVSNFAKEGRYSRHNTNYWLQVPYLGVGPGAHSYNLIERQYNVANNPKYIAAIDNGLVPSTVEHLELQDKINEYWMTSLRTKWGADLEWIAKTYGFMPTEEQRALIERYVAEGYAAHQAHKVVLNRKGLLFADQIASSLFI